ncbi:hypothetical protein PS687_04864 [Pseudomonas fluorescens]|jgi:hypothetical protein|nr:hypothetical protein PS664_02868 [Pseudomonas fluorescens]VVN63679.1 hypothetical protein PS687_04864 [Pseudomonas fluorescens]
MENIGQMPVLDVCKDTDECQAMRPVRRLAQY